VYVDANVQTLDERKAEEKDRLAIIIFVSDGQDHYFKDTDDMKETLTQHKLIKYPIHTFGVSVSEQDSGGGGAKALRAMADATSGSYTSITQDDGVDTMAVAEKLAQLSDKPTSIVAVDVNIHLRSLHPGVSLLRIESSSSSSAAAAADDHKSEIGDDKQSAEITMSTISSGEERKFTVYLNVPEGGQQKGNDDGGGVTTMELLAVGGSYKQSWVDDQEQVALGESVVTVARPPPPPPPSTSSCKELEWIEERVAYWHKVKLDLSAMYDKAEEEAAGAVKFQVTEALRQASVEAIDRAMHHDIYTVRFVFIFILFNLIYLYVAGAVAFSFFFHVANLATLYHACTCQGHTGCYQDQALRHRQDEKWMRWSDKQQASFMLGVHNCMHACMAY
jgi:hypothetical protein